MKRNAAAALAALCLLSGCAQSAAPAPELAQSMLTQPASVQTVSAASAMGEAVVVEKTAMAQETALALMREFTASRETFSFTPETFPTIAAVPSAAPLARAAAVELLGADAAAEPDILPALDTYRALLNGTASVILAEEPPTQVWDEKDAADFAWDMVPLAVDALVFAVSADNPVDSLTVEQVRDICAGRITNWSELGGPDLPIACGMDTSASGAETALENLVTGGASVLLPEAGLDGAAAPGALVCSLWYCAGAGNGPESGWKFLKIDGTAPSDQAAYPLLNRCYVLIPADVSGDDPALALRDWLLGSGGRALAERIGYVPVSELGGVP